MSIDDVCIRAIKRSALPFMWWVDTALFVFQQLGKLTVSGLSSGRTLCPSNKKRTVDSCFPCLSQKAFINFSNFVDLLILKKTSLLLSVTLMFKCSVGGGGASWPPLGDCSFSDMMSLGRGVEVVIGSGRLKQTRAQSLGCQISLAWLFNVFANNRKMIWLCGEEAVRYLVVGEGRHEQKKM